MAPASRNRKGQFTKKSRLNWIDNVTIRNKRRKKVGLLKSPVKSDSVRRVCELTQLAQDLWCTECKQPLSLRNVERESINGLASILSVRCGDCLAMFNVRTCRKSEGANLVGRGMFDVNKKAAIGMLDAGLGPSKVNTFLSALGVPAVEEKLLKRCERKVGTAVEELARESCVAALRLEKQLTKEDMEISMASSCEDQDSTSANSTFITCQSTPNVSNALASSTPNTESFPNNASIHDQQTTPRSVLTEVQHTKSPPTRLRASFDAGWQTRGNQRSYASKTGHASALGYYSKKIMGFSTRKTTCRFCKQGIAKSKHDCRKNFTRSAKAMEADMAVSLLANNPDLDKENCVIGVVIGDDDSSTLAGLRRSVTHSIDKWSDFNHAKKGISNALYSLKGPNKLSSAVIKYLTRGFGYAVKQNRNDSEKVRHAILVSVDHAFDNHTECGDWCGYRANPDTYKHRGLPNGKGLNGENLYQMVYSIFERYANNSERLAPCGSSQSNESFNSVVIRKHPKSEFYGDSESLDYRVASAVGQKNEGTSYVMDWNKRVELSPGSQTTKFRKRKNRKREQEATRKSSAQYKRRRLLLKGKHQSTVTANEEREGISYKSECDLPGVEFLLEETHECVQDATCAFVVFDLKTSGFGSKAEICQIAAVCNSLVFNRYIVPAKGIPPKVSEVTGLTTRGGDLFLRGGLLAVTPPRIAVTDFIDFLKKNSSSVILVAHNCFSFDAKQLTSEVKRLNLLQEFSEIVIGYADTLAIFKDKLPERKRAKGKFTQVELPKAYEIVSEDAHNAISDVKVLAELIQKLKVSDEDLRSNAQSLSSFANADAIKAQREEFFKVMGSAASKGTMNKIVNAGIKLEALINEHKTYPVNGVRLLLSQSVSGKARVTGNSKIIQKIADYVRSLVI